MARTETCQRSDLPYAGVCYHFEEAPKHQPPELPMATPRTPESILSAYFGPFAGSTWKLLPSIAAATRNQPYIFMDMDAYNALVRERPERAQAIYWREMIMRTHLSCCASLLRHTEWLNALFVAIEGNCFFGAYAACRGFLESSADACYSLSPVPKTLATSLAFIRARLKETRTDTVFISKELEDRMIHFTHGRKLQPKEVADPVHAAKQIREYLDGLQQLGVAHVHALYSELCSITHPSAESVLVWFEETKESQEVIWRRTEIYQWERIEKFLNGWRETNEGVFNAAFVPAFMSLRLLHKFDFLPKIPELKSFPLENFPAWKAIERQINK